MQDSSKIQRSGLLYYLGEHWRHLCRKGTAKFGSQCQPDSMYKKLGLGELKPTYITLSLADRSVKIPKGTVDDVLI